MTDHGPSVENFSVGDSGPTVEVSDLQRKDFVKYAGASGDFTPIHYDEPYAKAAGHSSVFAQGMLVAGHASRMVTQWFGLGHIVSYRVRFQSQVFPGDSVTIEGTIKAIDCGSDETTVEAEFTARNQDGEEVLTGSVKAIFDR